MDNRIDMVFRALKERDESAFIAYIGAGDPTIERTEEVFAALEAAGVDVVEMGLPFSDPLADGIVNQLSAQRALDAGATTRGVLDLVRRIRKTSKIPIVLYSYLNPLYTYGFEAFHKDAAEAGVDGLLTLDLPPDEARAHAELASAEGLRHIRLIAPTTPEARIKSIAAQGEGFLYYVSREGVTGERTSLADSIAEQVGLIKDLTEVPVAVGFGISTPEQAAEVAKSADGVVVGSAIVKIVAEYGESPELAEKVKSFVKPLVDATKSV